MLQPSASAATALVVLALASSSFAAQASPSVGSVVMSPYTDPNAPTNLAPGTYFTSGSINANIVWQASGVLSAGGCGRPNGAVIKVRCRHSQLLRLAYELLSFPSLATRCR